MNSLNVHAARKITLFKRYGSN